MSIPATKRTSNRGFAGFEAQGCSATGRDRIDDDHAESVVISRRSRSAGLLLARKSTVANAASAARWVEVRLSEARLVRLSADAVFVVYRASARRPEDADANEALASSAYVRRAGEWRLAFHQQSPSRPSE